MEVFGWMDSSVV